MIKKVLEEGSKTGFSAIDVIRTTVEKQEYEHFFDYRASHFTIHDRVYVRAFWDCGFPTGFYLSKPDVTAIRKAFANSYSADTTGKGENYLTMLPSEAKKVKIDIYDGSIDTVKDQEFNEITDGLSESLVQFPGLKMEKIHLAKTKTKKYIANTRGLNAKYKKTQFDLAVSFSLGQNQVEISDSRVFFNQINPFKTVSRAFNLLNSLTENIYSSGKNTFLIMYPEASTFILREFSNNLKLSSSGVKKGIVFPSVLNIIDDPLLDKQSGSAPFDDEGVQSGEKYLIKKGLVSRYISNIQTAFSHKQFSSGNGFRPEDSVFPSIRFSNLYIKPTVVPLKGLMKEAGNGILVSLIKLKFIEKGSYIFSAYGYWFQGSEIIKPVHFYFKTSFLSYFLNVIKISKEIKFFHSSYNIGSPYLLFEGKFKSKNLFEI